MASSPPFYTKALYEYKSDFEDDLSFDAGQVIKVTAIEDEEWFSGCYTDASGAVHSGMFPKNFVGEPLPEDSVTHAVQGEDVSAKEGEEEKEEVDDEPTPSISASVPVPAPVPVSTTKEKSVQDEEEAVPSQPHPSAIPKVFGSRSSTFNADSSLPMPSSKVADSSFGRKSYQGVPSSYIPPPLGKNPTGDSRSTMHHSSYVPPMFGTSHSNQKKSDENKDAFSPGPVASTTHNEPQEEDDGPKLSLKERIALLQKQQAEEAERRATASAATKKKHVKKPSVASPTTASVPPAIPDTGSSDGKSREVEKSQAQVEKEAGIPEIPGQFSVAQEDGDEEETAEKEATTTTTSTDEQEVADDLDKGVTGGLAEEDDDNQEDQDVEDEEDEEEEVEDSEETRRAALRDRMARLAGAGGMYGGFNPFGGVPGAPPATKTKSKPKDQKPAYEEEINIPSAPVPIMPFSAGTAPELPAALQKEKEERADDDAAEDVEPEDEEEDTDPVSAKERAGVPPIVETLTKEVEVDDGDEDNDEGFESAEETTNPASLAGKLASLDLSARPASGIHTESAVEGDDEREKDVSEDDYTFSDREREIKQTQLPRIATPVLDTNMTNIGSDYNTGYESDEDKDDETEDLDESIKTLDPKVEKEAPPPPPPHVAPSTTDADATPQITKAVPPPPPPTAVPVSVPQSTKVAPPPVSTETPSKQAPPPPIPTRTPIDSETPSRPIPHPITTGSVQSPTHAAPPPPLPTNAAPESPVSADYTPNKPLHRTRTSESSRSIPFSPVDQSPRIPPPIPGSGSMGTQSGQNMRKASTFSHSTETPRIDENVRMGSMSSRGTISSTPADFEVSNGWWLQPKQLPPSLQSKVGKELIFEVDEVKVKRRGGKELVLKDYYILNQDNIQTTLHVAYESHDPENTVMVSSTKEEAQTPTKSQLEGYAQKYGVKVFEFATKLVNQTIKEPLVPYILSQIPGVLPPVGLRSYGVTVYVNSNNSEVHQADDFRPGDIVAINKAKFQGHNKLRQKIVYDVGNTGVPFAAVLTEYDLEKRKFRVIEVDGNGKVKHSSYKPSDMKSGKIKVFRVVGRDFVQWD